MSKDKGSGKPQPPQPVDVQDGIPDRCRRRSAWKYALIALVMLAWLSLLVYFALASKAA